MDGVRLVFVVSGGLVCLVPCRGIPVGMGGFRQVGVDGIRLVWMMLVWMDFLLWMVSERLGGVRFQFVLSGMLVWMVSTSTSTIP